ncbi:Pho80p cyclin [Basidiobolus ranarum]|uniref:Pho80p cyclin n=1 Tax=Basidiobolus ranarum TaxID=34480 RepID=A0ABR2WUS7_9FUNG
MSSTLSVTAATTIEVPKAFYLADTGHLTHLIADMFNRLIAHNDQIPLTPSNLTRFHSRTPPAISVYEYLKRIVRYASVEKPCLIMLIVYIDRISELHRSFVISSLTVHRFLITAIVAASKNLCDAYCTNTHYAKVGGITTQEINALELEFLFFINWRLYCSPETLQQYYTNLVDQHPCYKQIMDTTLVEPGPKGSNIREVTECNDAL